MNSKNEALVVEANTGTQFTYRGVNTDADIRYCLCGCDLQVVKKAIYRPGHDARHVSQIVTAIVEFESATPKRKGSLSGQIRAGLAELPSVRLVTKAGQRLLNSLGEKHENTIATLVVERVQALQEDEDSED